MRFFLLSLILLCFASGAACTGEESMTEGRIVSAKIQTANTVDIVLSGVVGDLEVSDVSISPPVPVQQIDVLGNSVHLETSQFDVTENYTVQITGFGAKELQPDGVLDAFYSDKPLGCSMENGHTVFRVFAPRAKWVKVAVFESHDADQGLEYDMIRDEDGVWEFRLSGDSYGKYYAYKLAGPESPTEMFDPTKYVVDPYAKAVVTKNHYSHPGKALILDTSDYDWEGDTWVGIDRRDLVIYEMHVRDITAHESSGVSQEKRGSYLGLIEPDRTGGIDYIKRLGVNAVEFLPVQDFGNMELPYKDKTTNPTNNWNSYARNHWGYMTSYYFAPESYYATGGNMTPGQYLGMDGRQVRELKDVVKAFHRAGIAVLMDVVYNHVSEYDWNSLKLIDKKYYFRLDDDQNFTAESWCGNDYKSERLMARRLILNSVKYWMKEYHIDGFRFDLAALLDWETCEEILAEAKRINPNVIIIAEAWGGGKYELGGFSERGWAAWNDQIRNGVKGQNPIDGLGFIFGKWQGSNNIKSMKRYVLGTLKEDGGLFQEFAHSVNYLESHDDHTLGDFIRIGNGDVKEGEVVSNLEDHARLTERQMKLNKLGALFLFTSRGPVMIHEGQEYARSKVIAPTDASDVVVGTIDHNSYNKDDETNWLNYEHAEMNRELVDYYRGLIKLRKAHSAFRRAGKAYTTFLKGSVEFSFGFRVKGHQCGDTYDFVVLLNGDSSTEAAFRLPAGRWVKLADQTRAGTDPFGGEVQGRFSVPPTSGIVLRSL